jgi:hypothetical protein
MGNMMMMMMTKGMSRSYTQSSRLMSRSQRLPAVSWQIASSNAGDLRAG